MLCRVVATWVLPWFGARRSFGVWLTVVLIVVSAGGGGIVSCILDLLRNAGFDTQHYVYLNSGAGVFTDVSVGFLDPTSMNPRALSLQVVDIDLDGRGDVVLCGKAHEMLGGCIAYRSRAAGIPRLAATEMGEPTFEAFTDF